jgi:hypothetical protein
MADLKRCPGCECDLPLDAEHFGSDADQVSGFKSRCRACYRTQENARRDRERNADEVAALDEAALAGLGAFGTPVERECAEALRVHGGIAAAAAALQLTAAQFRAHLSELQRRAAARGWSPAHDMTRTTPEGFRVKGVSSYYGAAKDEDGNPTGALELRGQWVKTNREEEDKLAAMMDAMQAFMAPFGGAADPVPPPAHNDEDLLVVYPFGDPHVGMYAWAEETGDDFDLKIAERDMVAAVDALVSVAPAAKTAILVTVGDTFHADGRGNTTTGGTPVDVDTRWSKVFGVVLRTFRRSIDLARAKHEQVLVYIVGGNHDETMALVLAHCLAQYYEHDERVKVCVSPGAFHWYRFGKCLFGFAHGDKAKANDMPLIMACDCKEDWGLTEYRQIYSGHLHHEIVKEHPGVTVRTLRTLAPKDKWHASKGYRSGQDMRCDVWHREHGQIMQHSIGIAQVRKRREATE